MLTQPSPHSTLQEVAAQMAKRIMKGHVPGAPLSDEMCAYLCGTLDVLGMIYPVSLSEIRRLVEEEMKKYP